MNGKDLAAGDKKPAIQAAFSLKSVVVLLLCAIISATMYLSHYLIVCSRWCTYDVKLLEVEMETVRTTPIFLVF